MTVAVAQVVLIALQYQYSNCTLRELGIQNQMQQLSWESQALLTKRSEANQGGTLDDALRGEIDDKVKILAAQDNALTLESQANQTSMKTINTRIESMDKLINQGIKDEFTQEWFAG